MHLRAFFFSAAGWNPSAYSPSLISQILAAFAKELQPSATTAADVTTVKERILLTVEKNPGCHFRQIKREIHASTGATQYNIDILEKERKIVSVHSGLYKRFYRGILFNEKDQEILNALLSSTEREIIMFLIEKPLSSQKQVSEQLHLSPATISWHMKKLRASGMVSEIRNGISAKYSLSLDPEKVVSLLKVCRPNLWETWSDRVDKIIGEMAEG